MAAVSKLPAAKPAKFVHGTYPPSPEIARPKPPKPPNTRDYGKAERPGFGTTGMTGET